MIFEPSTALNVLCFMFGMNLWVVLSSCLSCVRVVFSCVHYCTCPFLPCLSLSCVFLRCLAFHCLAYFCVFLPSRVLSCLVLSCRVFVLFCRVLYDSEGNQKEKWPQSSIMRNRRVHASPSSPLVATYSYPRPFRCKSAPSLREEATDRPSTALNGFAHFL